jgi:hypothetical protein
MRVDPFTGDVVHLTNADAAFRRRVGDYRILFDVFRRGRRRELESPASEIDRHDNSAAYAAYALRGIRTRTGATR